MLCQLFCTSFLIFQSRLPIGSQNNTRLCTLFIRQQQQHNINENYNKYSKIPAQYVGRITI